MYRSQEDVKRRGKFPGQATSIGRGEQNLHRDESTQILSFTRNKILATFSFAGSPPKFHAQVEPT